MLTRRKGASSLASRAARRRSTGGCRGVNLLTSEVAGLAKVAALVVATRAGTSGRSDGNASAVTIRDEAGNANANVERRVDGVRRGAAAGRQARAVGSSVEPASALAGALASTADGLSIGRALWSQSVRTGARDNER